MFENCPLCSKNACNCACDFDTKEKFVELEAELAAAREKVVEYKRTASHFQVKSNEVKIECIDLESENERLKTKAQEWKKRADFYEKRVQELQRNVDPRIK